jgi:hypothetical protein
MLAIYDNPAGLRVIQTARTKEAINQAAKAGFWPLVKPVIPSAKIKRKFSVRQNKESGEIEVISDFRAGSIRADGSKLETVIGFKFYYPHHFESPYAAYLIPPDLQAGEKVFLEDLIEDLVGGKWNQGDTFRLRACEAIWDGSDLIIQFEENENFEIRIG